MTTSTELTDPKPPATARPGFWRGPFQVDTWRRTAYLLAAGPVALIALLSALVSWAPGAALPTRLAVALRIIPRGEVITRPPLPRVALHALLGIPLGIASLVITAYGWSLVALNVGYPLRSGSDLSGAWGGPTLAGAWAVHAAAGLAFLFVVPWVIDRLTAAHRWTLRRAGLIQSSMINAR